MSKPCKCLTIAGYRNVYPDGFGIKVQSRKDCDAFAIPGRIGIQPLYGGKIEPVVSNEVDALEGKQQPN